MSYKLHKQYRHKEHDYSQDGFYFVTVCCKNREMFLGDVVGGKIKLSEIGKIVEKFWLEIPNNFSVAKLDEFSIMPNHVHGIIQIDNDANAPGRNAPWRVPTMDVPTGRVPTMDVPTGRVPTMDVPTGRVPTGIQPLVKNSLSSIINHFKGNAKRWCNKNNLEYFAWQARFHDRIIRNNDELNRIRQYILNNPIKWELDRNNQEKLFM